MTPDVKHAYVVNDQTVSAYVGQSESNSLKKIGKEQDSIIDCKKAVSILQKSMATELKINVKEWLLYIVNVLLVKNKTRLRIIMLFLVGNFKGKIAITKSICIFMSMR